MYRAVCSKCGQTATTKGPGHSVFIDGMKMNLLRGAIVFDIEKRKEDGVMVTNLVARATMSPVDDMTEDEKKEAKFRAARNMLTLLVELTTTEDLFARFDCQHVWNKVEEV